MGKLIKKIQNTAFQNNLWQRGSRIIVGVSGGPDSVCLLDVLVKLATKYDFKLIIAHVNYNLRGNDSHKDEEFVRKLAKKYGIKIFTLTRPDLYRGTLSRKRAKGNFLFSENNLRDIRYEFFEKLRKKNNFDFIAVAHNLDDQAETILMRIIRGTGLSGLAAMKYKNNKIIRPLLGVSRKEILKYLKDNKLKYRIDKTNESDKFLRNKIRNKLIPHLEKNFNPQVKRTIFNAAISIGEDYDLISEISRIAYQKNKELKVNKILTLHPALQKRILLEAVMEKRGNLKDIEALHIEELIKALKSTKNKLQTVSFKGLKFVIKDDKVIIN
jgi:tRNA(Ile)-lysidine synthase